MHSLTEYLGRWAIRAAARPPVWPFLRDALIDIRPAAAEGRAFLSVRTAGGALLRSYTLAWHATRDGIALSVLEYNGRAYVLTLTLTHAGDGRSVLAGAWTSVGSAGVASTGEGGWEAERLAQIVEPVAA